ncbi:sepiapterin reductase-like isoform X1 [Sitophilus oryzae]|uniref:Sepiapterin reductase-like isoform X1 n=1 Tax=Sitophilus oryzae TaxID=7048 RepID=A0A6J2YXR7_SITOR|nr:sepiapterin reductase-like isoform X1 [Sitophilus oryzae]
MANAVNFLKKSIIVITGASKGIGQTIAVGLARNLSQNSIFVLIARSEKGLEETKKQIGEIDKGITVLTYVTDLSKPNLEVFVDIFNKVLNSIDSTAIEYGYVFHNAGSVGVIKETTELGDLQTWKDYYDLNLFSTVLLNNVFIQKIRPIAPQLVVVNITSLCGNKPFTNLSMYGSGKAARQLFFKVLAVEQPNIIVLNYSPGPVKTEMFDSICDTADSKELRDSFEKVRNTSVLTTNQTVEKMLEILEKGDFVSGDVIDYFDRV